VSVTDLWQAYFISEFGTESQIGPVSNEYLNRYVTEEDERDLDARDGEGGRYGNYEYGQDTMGTKHMTLSKEYFVQQKEREETRESLQFWLWQKKKASNEFLPRKYAACN